MTTMEPNLSLYEDTLQFYLVSSGDSQWSSHMQFALEKLEEHICANNIRKVTPDECIYLAGNFTKKHIVVIEEFNGECFETARKTQALVLGPRCVISCFMDNVSLPDINSPMFTLAMRDLTICFSSLRLEEKAELRQLIGYMGGRYIEQLAESTTHLVTDSVLSKKYEIAIMQKMKIMKKSWVRAVWEECLQENVLATSQKFEVHVCPPFYKLRVTTTGINRREKKEVEDAIKNGGGDYYGEFSSSSIDIVIAKRDATETAKLKAAINAKKDCLCPEWIKDSVKAGVALPIEDYKIDLLMKKTTSTPDKTMLSGQFNNSAASATDISHIQFTAAINETAMLNLSITSNTSLQMDRRSKATKRTNENKDLSYVSAFEKLNIQDAKKAGAFLDGCSVFICGFATEEKEKIMKILNAGRATRYDTINSNLSHILVGNPSKKDLTMLQAVPFDAILVKLEWLVECVVRKAAVDCDPYLYHLNTGKGKATTAEHTTAPSPASKRNILLMSGQSKQATPKRLNFADGNLSMDASRNESQNNNMVHTQTEQGRAEDELIDQYLKAPTPQPAAAAVEPIAGPSKPTDGFKKPAQPIQPAASIQSSMGSENADQYSELDSEFSLSSEQIVPPFLAGLKVHIRKFDHESHETLVNDCEAAGAKVIEDENYKGTVDFLILPMDATSMDGINVKAKNIVNHNWLINAKKLKDCSSEVAEQKVSDKFIPYFYKPIFIEDDVMPLEGLNIAISLYPGDERQFLQMLIGLLGANFEESYVRPHRPVLICPEAKSEKYRAAIRWKLPVVEKRWLLTCYEMRKRVSLKPYLIGDSVAPIDDVEDDDEILNSQPVFMDTPGASAAQSRRVEQLKGSKPRTAPSSPDDCLNELDTPTRNSILQRYKELEEETPQTKRRRYDQDGIHSPECATTPYWTEFKRQQLEERRTRHAPTQEQIDKIKNRTPWSEVKRNFWKEALGEEYESPSQCYSANMQRQNVAPNVNTTVTSRPSGRQLNYEPSHETEADENIQMLAAFINKNKRENNEPEHYVDLPNTAPPDSEMISTEPHEVIGWRDPSDVVEDTPKRIPKPKYCFIISCSDDQIREKIVKQINALNGKACDVAVKYDIAVTHFVCEKPSRSEKMMSCVAAGKWVLGLDYIQKSFEAKRFINEEEYEWGNPKATTLPPVEGNDFAVASAAHRLRKKFQQSSASKKGAFQDFRVILVTAKFDSLRTLIEAGHGKVIELNKKVPLEKQLTGITHVICQTSSVKFTADEFKILERAKVPCVTINYLQAFITSETLPDITKFLINRSKS